MAAAVAHDNDRGKGEAPTALHDLRHAVYLHHALGQLQPIGIDFGH